MEHTSTASIKVARGLLVAIFALSFYRAVTQSVTPGEAWNYNLYIAPEWPQTISGFDGNNHVLNTLLIRIFTFRLHVTEIWLRVPSLLGGVLYLAAVWKLARRFGTGLMFLAAIGLLVLHPMVVDSLSEARGYGMGLAFWCWGLELLLESSELQSSELHSSEQASRQKLNLAGVCLGLSVASALAFLAPAGALILVFATWSRGRGGAVAGWAFLTAFVLLVIPLNRAEWNTLAVGATSLRQTINELSAVTFGTSSKTLAALARISVGIAAAAGAVAAGKWWRGDKTLVVLTGGTLALSLTLLILAHSWELIPFPQGGSIYMIPLITLVVMSIILELNIKHVQFVVLLVSAVWIGRYLTELPVGMYASGQQFAGGRELAKTLRVAAAGREVRFATSRSAIPIMEFYKRRYRQGNWQVSGPDFSGVTEFYVLSAGSGGVVGHLHVLYQDAGLKLLQRY